jgi:hypothetical protein
LGSLLHIQQTAVHQEGDLLDDGERVGDATGPEIGPKAVDAAS